MWNSYILLLLALYDQTLLLVPSKSSWCNVGQDAKVLRMIDLMNGKDCIIDWGINVDQKIVSIKWSLDQKSNSRNYNCCYCWEINHQFWNSWLTCPRKELNTSVSGMSPIKFNWGTFLMSDWPVRCLENEPI